MRPWICPRCHKVNAPWLAQCFCAPVPTPITQPGTLKVTDARRLPDGSFELRMDEQ